MNIEIHIERPVSLLILTVLTVTGVSWSQLGEQPVTQASGVEVSYDAHGGSEDIDQITVYEQEQFSRQIRKEQELAGREEEILRYQIRKLEEQMQTFQVEYDPEIRDEYHASVKELIDLLMDKKRAESELMQSLIQIQEASNRALAIPLAKRTAPIRLAWPVQPIYGISAHFDDPSYREVFGFAHKAVDIPVEQNTTITAPADGVVEEYQDNGTGYSWLTIRHDGYVTLYGHITNALVKPGDNVWMGDPIALSGGLPGSKGAGRMTTGPHLHFELITDEGNIDPEPYLPEL